MSIGGDKHFDNIKAFVKSVSQFIDLGMQESLVEVVLFARDAWIEFDLQQYLVQSDLIEAIDDLQIYDHIYTVGIRGNRAVDFEELNYIATDESQVIIIDDFSIEILMGVQRTLTDIVCNRKLTMQQFMHKCIYVFKY